MTESAGNQNYRPLLDFSLGRINHLEVVSSLGVDSEEDLFLLMAKSRLPMPRLPDKTTQEMVDELKTLAA